VTNGGDHNLLVVKDSKQRHIPRRSKWNDQFTPEPISVGNAAGEWGGLKDTEFVADCRHPRRGRSKSPCASANSTRKSSRRSRSSSASRVRLTLNLTSESSSRAPLGQA